MDISNVTGSDVSAVKRKFNLLWLESGSSIEASSKNASKSLFIDSLFIHVVMIRSVLGKTLGFVGYAVQYGCIAHCAFEYIGEVVVCSGPSMEPTIVNQDIVFSERMSRHLCKIQKGDIVIAKSPFDPNMNICKRVIGLEGDKVCTSGPSDFFKTHTYVPKGHVWLEGDNLRNSSDSRSYGPIPYALIRGRVCLKLWPLHSVGTLSKSPSRRIIKSQSDSD